MTRVCVYKNLTRDCWSEVPATVNGNRGVGVKHHDAIALTDCRMVVKEPRRQHVLKTRVREVHAWIVGTPCAIPDGAKLIEVTYNPYRSAFFHTRDGRAVTSAKQIVFTDKCYLVE